MKRSIIHPSVKPKAPHSLSVEKTVTRTQQLTGVALDKRLRQKRSAAFISAMTQLDAGGMTSSQTKIDELKQTIQNEFPELSPSQLLVGIVAKCFLGNPYVVHTLDLDLDVVEHFQKGAPLPGSLERARSLAQHPGYEFVEVYTDELRAVSANGTVAVIKG
ncbi:hypothetical protein BBI11_13030 [Planococcus maritimus]|uniref:hypothetical protein n=1 Tax=Planococcus maritimus TaxID=192421 RepID=UPI00080EEACD|nr:hypothetical protein [Planococcus maritimus]ANU17898.1 hypothetical protein BBI11_13030 [Planococcus maritimus]